MNSYFWKDVDRLQGKMSATNLWNSSSENTLILFFANILAFVVCFENMFHFFFHSGLAMEPVYQFLQENPQDS